METTLAKISRALASKGRWGASAAAAPRRPVPGRRRTNRIEGEFRSCDTPKTMPGIYLTHGPCIAVQSPIFFCAVAKLRDSGGFMFGRIANLFKGFLSLFVSGIERRNPEALLELEQENLRKQIGQFNQGLAVARRPLRAPHEPGPQARSRREGPARQDHRARARRQQFRRRPVRAAPADRGEPAHREPHPARTGREDLQGSGEGPRRGRADRARQDREPQGRHQRHAHEAGHGRDPRDVGGHDHEHRRRRRHPEPPRDHGQRGTRQGRGPRARGARRRRHVGRGDQGSRDDRARRPGAGGLRGARRHHASRAPPRRPRPNAAWAPTEPLPRPEPASS